MVYKERTFFTLFFCYKVRTYIRYTVSTFYITLSLSLSLSIYLSIWLTLCFMSTNPSFRPSLWFHFQLIPPLLLSCCCCCCYTYIVPTSTSPLFYSLSLLWKHLLREWDRSIFPRQRMELLYMARVPENRSSSMMYDIASWFGSPASIYCSYSKTWMRLVNCSKHKCICSIYIVATYAHTV